VSAFWGAAADEAATPDPTPGSAANPESARPAGWRAFLRGLAMEMEAQAGPAATASVLRAVGQHMARLMALPPVGSMEALEMEMNAVLAEIGWGSVRLAMNEAERCLVLAHAGLPRIGSAGEPAGSWLAPVLEGLYQGWMGQQPGADEQLRARIQSCGGLISIRYGRL
jgi:hypothetical protein